MPRLHPITLLVLAHITACARPRQPSAEPVHAEEPPSLPIAVDAVTPEPTPSVTSPPPEPKRCTHPNDCPPSLSCVKPFDGHRVIPGPGTCQRPGPRPGGRPLLVDGEARVSRPVATRAWLDEAERDGAIVLSVDESATLRRSAFDEHASVAAFARTICQLLALGAPASLVARSQQALADEIRHAEQTFAWVSRLEGAPVGPGPLAAATAPLDASPEAVLRDVFRGGCVGETLAAYEADARGRATRNTELAAFHARIADDEARHAALAYDTAAWMAAAFPALAAVLDEERERFLASASGEEVELLAPLLAVLS